ncbi:nitronate monooxygenase family protein [Roseobacter sp. N2S]|uniref:NAD(P)H-dependent flavin oxidoreductase n=1 Tax=Roseobacter sp. N2S TaxID=2663844 RepID=UPI00285DE074|nr:nitronate monooxygenase family protein [Roseobacter sp. N2S]MDR6265833.1 NAD(P)H-dependent flavin oxidoreductase YrpB (nitropropane dioxygenase family) [Roseobacter sp. N2S]
MKTQACNVMGIELPIFGFSHSVAVTAAISNAGGLGVYGATHHQPDEIIEVAKQLRQLCGDRPFALDLLLPQTVGDETNLQAVRDGLPAEHKAFVAGLAQKYKVPKRTEADFFSDNVRSQSLFARQVEAALASEADVFAAAVGVPAEVIERAKAAGKKTIALIGAPRHARKALEAGVDLLVAQGHDAGAHTGKIGTFSLVPQVVDIAGDIPVLAAGGVGTGRHLAAALALGAQGVWMGTAWLTTIEHGIDDIVLQKLLAAQSEDTLISRSYSGKTLRMIRTAWSDEWNAPDAPEPLAMPYQQALIGEFLAGIRQNRVAPLMWEAAGQSIAYFNEETTVADIIKRTMSEAKAAARVFQSAETVPA